MMLTVSDVSMTYDPPHGVMRWLSRSASAEPVKALDGVSLGVERGEVVGLVGPNGAGKTTLIKAITTLLVPTAGTITLDGILLDADNPDMRRRFGLVLPEERSFYWRLTGRQNLNFFAALAGLERSVADSRIDRIMEERGLAHRDKAVFGYSSGMRAQLAIARAILHQPDLIVLDEPTRSLDPVAGAAVCDDLRQMAAEGRAILMASHRLDEVVSVCDRVLALAGGRIRWQGTAAEIAGDPIGLGATIRGLVDSDHLDSDQADSDHADETSNPGNEP